MLLPDWAVLNAAIDWLGHGLWNLAWWQIVLYTLATTHVTIAAVTIFLHRAQEHRALDLHPLVSHFFRFCQPGKADVRQALLPDLADVRFAISSGFSASPRVHQERYRADDHDQSAGAAESPAFTGLFSM